MEKPLFLTEREIEIILKAMNKMERIPLDGWDLMDKLEGHLQEKETCEENIHKDDKVLEITWDLTGLNNSSKGG